MTLEEALKKNQELEILLKDKEDELSKIANKNKELLDEKKKMQLLANEKIDIAKYQELDEKYNLILAEKAKIEKDLHLKNSSLEESNKKLNELTLANQNAKINSILDAELRKAGVSEGVLAGAKALIKANAKLNEKDEVLINDKPLNDYMSEWVKNEGASYISTNTTGGGANKQNIKNPSFEDLGKGMLRRKDGRL